MNKTPCSDCTRCAKAAQECANMGTCLKQIWEYPKEQGDPKVPAMPDPRQVDYV